MKLFMKCKKRVTASKENHKQVDDMMIDDEQTKQLAKLQLELKQLRNELKKYSYPTDNYIQYTMCLYYQGLTTPLPLPCIHFNDKDSAHYRHQRMKYTEQIDVIEAKIATINNTDVEITTANLN